MANQIRRHDSRIPIIGISAYEAEPGYTRIFDSFYHKSSTNIEYDFLSNIVRIKDMIESYNCEKYADAPQRLIRFKEKYAISDSDFQYLISSLPICNKLDSTLLALHDFETIDDASDQRSKTFTIVSADSDLAIRYGLKSDLPVVVTETTENVFVSEIFSLPTIYAYGSTHEEAIELLLESLKDYASQLRDTSSEDLDIIKFGIFLKEIFDA